MGILVARAFAKETSALLLEVYSKEKRQVNMKEWKSMAKFHLLE